MKRMISVAALLGGLVFLTGCGGALGNIEDFGAKGLDTLEQSSALTLKGAKRYMCETVRVGPLRDMLQQDEDKEAWAKLCDRANNPLRVVDE